jgi:hypothetical protein
MKKLFYLSLFLLLHLSLNGSIEELNDALEILDIRKAEHIIRNKTFDYNLKDPKGRLPLVIATKKGLSYIARTLLINKADPEIHDSFGDTAYSSALENEDLFILRLFNIRKITYQLRRKKKKLLKSKDLKLPTKPTSYPEETQENESLTNEREPLISRGQKEYEEFYDMDTCSICQEDIIKEEEATYIECCNHLLHNYCLAQWKREKPECPLCRSEIKITPNHIKLYSIKKELSSLHESSFLLYLQEQQQRSLDLTEYLM